MHIRSLVATVLLLSTQLAGCGDEAKTSAPESPHGTPAEAPHGSPHRGDGAAAPAAPASGAKLDLSGTITFAGTFPAAAVFVSVKDPTRPGPPVAAKQLPAGPFPLTFTLTDADVIQMGATPPTVPEKVALTARLDLDGNAMSKDPTEPIATIETASTASGLAIALAAPSAAPAGGTPTEVPPAH